MATDSRNVHFMITWIEDRYPADVYSAWTRRHPILPIVTVIAYMMSIYAGQRIMKERKPFSMKPLLLAWNTGLAVFSVMAGIRIGFSIHHSLSRMGLLQRICFSSADAVSMFWGFLFVFSKFAELGDTLFLILRKKNVIFLHWYHHVTVLLFTWFTYADDSALGHFFSLVNLVVHSFMYTYYALQTMGYRFPRFVSMSLTVLQISQMVLGMYILSLWQQSQKAGLPCGRRIIWTSGVLMYASYFALFLHFFYKSYIQKRDTPVHKSLKNGMPAKSE